MESIKTWPDEVTREVSGFGGSYEAGCRAMIMAGFNWIDANPDASPQYRGFKGVFGLVTDSNPDATKLDEAILNAKVITEDGKEARAGDECTGAMHHAAVKHCLFYKANGWEKWKQEMTSKGEDD